MRNVITAYEIKRKGTIDLTGCNIHSHGKKTRLTNSKGTTIGIITLREREGYTAKIGEMWIGTYNTLDIAVKAILLFREKNEQERRKKWP